jgi:hypothetical protein
MLDFGLGSANFNTLENTNGSRVSTSANTISGGVCPATLGTLTNSSAQQATVLFLLEP